MLNVHNLSFERQYRYLFRDLNFAVSAGKIIQVTGMNGSGKSTLLRILAGYIEPEIGTICWNGKTISNIDHYQQTLCYVGHQNGIRPELTVRENLNLLCALIQLQNTSIDHTLQTLRLTKLAHTLAKKLSAGQLRRVALARLLLKPSALWILDEPMTSLDKEGKKLLNELIEQHLANNGMLVIATHEPLIINAAIDVIELGKIT